jgi:hypothetical protein
MDPSCHFPRSLSGTLAQSPDPRPVDRAVAPRRARCHDSSRALSRAITEARVGARSLSRAITERASTLDRCHVRSPSARRCRSLSRASLVRRGDRASSRATTGEHRSLVASRDLDSRTSIDHHAHACERRTAPALARGATSRLACERRDHRRRARRRSARPRRRTLEALVSPAASAASRRADPSAIASSDPTSRHHPDQPFPDRRQPRPSHVWCLGRNPIHALHRSPYAIVPGNALPRGGNGRSVRPRRSSRQRNLHFASLSLL